jgi:hypothetical protein
MSKHAERSMPERDERQEMIERQKRMAAHEKRIIERRVGGVYSIQEWLIYRQISSSALYRLWAMGKGPRRTRIGGRVFISDQSDLEFMALCTEPAPAIA